MEKLKELAQAYAERIMDWYNGLEQLYQYGVFFLVIVVGLLIFSFFFLKRITR
ncbi:MAG TPA: hypothetical protein PKH03_11560 [Syntrophales bacterium]|nr:hypothetical protein [Syntrophales bacterium]